MKEWQVNSVSELDDVAADFLSAFMQYRVFAFSAEMGAGKTTFIKSLCRALGVLENVTSPTFSIVNEYMSADGNPVYHFDFYRIEKKQEAIDIGISEYFYSGNYCFVEWPEKILHLLPEDACRISINLKDNTRIITFNNV